MSVLFTDVMTVYNYHKNSGTGEETWIRTVVRGVQWAHGRKVLVVSNGIQTEEQVEDVTVDFARSYKRHPYTESTVYEGMVDTERPGYWTLNSKNGLDILVLGECQEEITSENDIDIIRKQNQYVVIVSSVADHRNRPRLKHIKVVAK